MTKLHHQIFSLLLPVCLDINQRMREKYEVKPDEKNDQKSLRIGKLKAYLKSRREELRQTVQSEYVKGLLETPITICSFILDDKDWLKALDYEKGNQHDEYEPLSVIVREKPQSNTIDIPVDVPLLVLHGQRKKVLLPNGRESERLYNYDLASPQETIIASDEQVEECLSNLTTAQLRFILANDIFAASLSPLLEETEDVVAEEENKKDTEL